MLSPSELVMQACGRTPAIGDPAKEGGRCAMCGKLHNKGDSVFPFKPDDSFTDVSSLAVPGSPVMCGACVGVWNEEFTQKYMNSVICSEGVYPFASNNDIAYWLMNPPKPPFMLMIGDQKRQHLVWRTPINHSREIYQVRFGSKLLTIRRSRLAPALEACDQLSAAASIGRKGGALKSPFQSMARALKDIKHSKINSKVYDVVKSNPELKPALDFITNLTPGELWALTALLYGKEPSKPDPVFTPASTH
jgi:CRISPR type IV-associated protein Csf1